MNTKRNIILDCDPGHDDAVAIILAGNSDKLNLLGITTVSGNQTIEKTAVNAFNVAKYIGLNVLIYLGASKPLIRERINCPEIHGESGLDGFTFPKYDYVFGNVDAVSFIHQSLNKYKSVTLAATGPLTNIASLLIKYPKDIDKIEEIVLMGGSVTAGNITKEAEFNIYADAEAADIVFSSGVHIKMVGLNVTRQALLMPDVIKRFANIDSKVARMVTTLMDTFNKNQQAFFHLVAAPLHDPLTIASLIDEDVLGFEAMDVQVVTKNNELYGKTIVKENKNARTLVATSINLAKFWDVVASSLKKYR